MKNILDILKNSSMDADKTLLNIILNGKHPHLLKLLQSQYGEKVNRGHVFEMLLTGKRADFGGEHGTSNGDTTIKGKRYEIKYITRKTGATDALKGTTAKQYIIGFNHGNYIEIRVIDHKDLILKPITNSKNNPAKKITFQDNYNKGRLLKRF